MIFRTSRTLLPASLDEAVCRGLSSAPLSPPTTLEPGVADSEGVENGLVLLHVAFAAVMAPSVIAIWENLALASAPS